MSSLAQLPESVISLLHENAAALWAWVSEQHYAQVVGQAGPADLLGQVKQRFDFHAIEQACAGFHVYAGQQGQAPTHTIGQLCRGLVVRQLRGWLRRELSRTVVCADGGGTAQPQPGALVCRLRPQGNRLQRGDAVAL